MFQDRRIPARTPITAGVLSPSMRATMTPLLRGGGSTTVRTGMSPMGTRIIPARTPISAGTGGIRLSVSPVSPSTLATRSAFGGANGGMGAATPPLGPTTLTGFTSSVSKAGVGIMNTFGSLIPLAIKVILAVIVVKIVLWLIKRR